MEYKIIGDSGLRVSKLSLGCMSFHSFREGQPIINAALDVGVNFFDTADLYDRGENESILGKALEGQRKDVFIASKVGNRWRPDGSGWDWVPKKAHILQAVEESLRRLRTDYIDLYQLHGGTIDDPLDEVVEAFDILKTQGKIRAYGISSIRPNTIRRWTTVSTGASCMSQYSLLDRRPEEFILDHLHSNGHSMLVRGALAKGLLANKNSKPYLGHDARAVTDLQIKMRQFASEEDAAGLAIAYTLQAPAVASVVLGASTSSQIADAVRSWHSVRQKEIDFGQLADNIPAFFYDKHR